MSLIPIEIPYKLNLFLTSKKNNLENPIDNLIKYNVKNPYVFNPLVIKLIEMNLKESYLLKSDISNSKINIKFELFNFSNQTNKIDHVNLENFIYSNGIAKPINLENFMKFIPIKSNQIKLIPINYNEDKFNFFMSKIKSDANKFINHIPIIYLYGNIIDENSNVLTKYYICDKIFTYENLSNKNFEFVGLFYKKLLEFLILLKNHNYIVKDLCLKNLGWIVEKNLNKSMHIQILNYTHKSFIDINQLKSQSSNFNDKINLIRIKYNEKSYFGTLIPFYIISDYYNLNINWIDRLDKYYCLGLCEIMLIIFFNKTNGLDELYNLVTELSKLNFSMHYYHFYERFKDELMGKKIKNLVNDLEFKFIDAHPIYVQLIKNTIINMLEINYDNIVYPEIILHQIEKVEQIQKQFKIYPNDKNDIFIPDENNFENLTMYDMKNIILENKHSNQIELTNLNLNSNENLNQNSNENLEDKEKNFIDLINLNDLTNSNDSNDLNDLNNLDLYKKKYIKYKIKYNKLKKKFVY